MTTLNDFEHIAKRSKQRNRLKTIFMTLVVALLLALSGYYTLNKLTAFHAHQIAENYELVASVAYPNISSQSMTYTATSQFSGYFKANRTKDLDGVAVAFPAYQQYYNAQSSWFDGMTESLMTSKEQTYTYDNAQKVPQFYNTKAKAQHKGSVINKPTQEVNYLSQMQGQLVELALTFDKPYTYKELQEKLPKNIKANWYWLGTKSQLDVSQLYPNSIYGMNDEDLRDNSSAEQYFEQLDKVLTKKLSTIFADYDMSKDLKFSINQAKAKRWQRDELSFSGMIVTGTAENLQALAKQPWLYASSIGAQIQKQPYYQLEKE